jgi:hypothetical protein
VAGVALLPARRWHLTPDGVAYLSIADHLTAGRVAESVNAYWSPLWSWLTAPFLAVGVPPLVAAKLVGLLTAVLVLVLLDRLLRTVGVGDVPRLVALLGTVPLLLQGALTWISPDLLVVAPVLVLADRLIGGSWRRGWRAAAATGVAAGLAYLAKLYALPFVAVAIVAAIALAARTDGPLALRRGAVAVGVAAAIVGSWAAVLSVDRGEVTVGTSGQVNTDLLADGSRGSPLLWAGLFHPPHPTSVTAWEDPSRLDPGAEVDPRIPAAVLVDEAADGGTADGRAADGTGDGADEGATDDGGSWLAGLLGNVPDNLSTTAGFAASYWPVALAAIAAAAALLRRGSGVAGRVAALVTLAAVWAGGLQLLVAHPRYLWPAALLLLPVAALLLDRVRRPAVAAVLALALLLGWLPGATAKLEEHRDHGLGAATLGEELPGLGLAAGDRVATDRYWNIGTTTCFHVGCRFHGMLTGDAATDRRQLEDHGIEWLLVWDDEPLPVPTTSVGETTIPTGVTVELHRIG